MAKLVYAGMSADIIHSGHLNIIREAQKYGSLMVGVLTDEAIASYKRLPYLDFQQRISIVSQLKGVDRVVPQTTLDYIPNLRLYKPDFVIHGDDWKSGIQKEVRRKILAVLKEWGGELIEVPYTQNISSTRLNEAIREVGTTPDIRRKRLKRLLEAKPFIRILEAHSGISAHICEHAFIKQAHLKKEFDGIWSSSLVDSALRGKEDNESVDFSSRLSSLNDILEKTTKPIIFDGNTGGQTVHFVGWVKTLERLGVSAIVIEDKQGLKQNSLLGKTVPQQQEDPDEFAAKIHAGKQAQVTDSFLIFARIESFIAGKGCDDALARARKYLAAGADGIMIHSSSKDAEDIREFCRQYNNLPDRKYLILVPTAYNTFFEEELASWGANMIIYANHLIRSAYPAMERAAQMILEHGRSLEADPFCMTSRDLILLFKEKE